MKIAVDTHTHTIISGHAYSTIYENMLFASRLGLEGVVTAEHGPALPGTSVDFSIEKLADVPEIIEGVRAYRGAEANIVDYSGKIDIRPQWRRIPDYMLASLHDVVIENGGMVHNTNAMLAALNIPEVDAIAHPGNPYFPIDQLALVREAKRLDKILEVNNHSFRARSGSLESCRQIVRLCGQHGVRVSVASDAHNCMDVGRVDYALNLLEEEHYPEDRVINSTTERFESYLRERAQRMATCSR
jgi:putative hydrolase